MDERATLTYQPRLMSAEDAEARASDFQSVATPATSATWPPAERQTAPGGSSTCNQTVKPQEAYR